jgi:hypothetical protein
LQFGRFICAAYVLLISHSQALHPCREISSMDEESAIASAIPISDVEGAGEFAGGAGRSRGGVGCAGKLFQEPRRNIGCRNQSSMKNSGSSFVLQFVFLLLRQCQHVNSFILLLSAEISRSVQWTSLSRKVTYSQRKINFP